MKLFNKISSKTSAFILLFSFLGIYLINIGCSIGNYASDLTWFSETVENHEHGNHTHKDGYHHDHGDKKDNKEKDDGCCDDEATTFFASVQVAPTSSVEYDFSPIQFDILYSVETSVSKLSLPISYFSEYRPPPDIQLNSLGVRIAIQSFQI